jgi:uncharacterized protein YllA (UPF0747 family)
MNYDNVYEATTARLHKLRFAKNGIKHHLNKNIDYPKISGYGQTLQKALVNFVNYYRRTFMRHKNQKDFAQDHKEIVKRARNIAKDIKAIIKQNLIPALFPAYVHKNLINYSKILDTTANTLLSMN